MICFYVAHMLLSKIIGDLIPTIIYWIFTIIIYSKYAAGMWMRT